MADISKVKLPNGNSYDIKDSVARNATGTLTNLLTTSKNDLVSAINEVYAMSSAPEEATGGVVIVQLNNSNLTASLTPAEILAQRSQGKCVYAFDESTGLQYSFVKYDGTSGTVYFAVSTIPDDSFAMELHMVAIRPNKSYESYLDQARCLDIQVDENINELQFEWQ